jgi:hypothetical protein
MDDTTRSPVSHPGYRCLYMYILEARVAPCEFPARESTTPLLVEQGEPRAWAGSDYLSCANVDAVMLTNSPNLSGEDEDREERFRRQIFEKKIRVEGQPTYVGTVYI